MSLKNILLISLVFLLLVNFARADDIKINLISQQPELITPGNYFSVVFQAENTDYQNKTNVEFEIVPDASLIVEGDDTKKVSVLEPLKPVQLNYRLRVSSDSLSGFKELKLKYDDGEKGSDSFNVFVNAIETNLVINEIKQDQLIPGNKGKLTINLQNKASYKLKDVKVILDLTSVPFAPSGSSGEKTLDIQGYGTSEVIFDLIALPDAEAGIYKIPIKIIYFDEFSRSYNITNLISITISAYPYLDTQIEKNDLIENLKSAVNIKLVNRGLINIKFLNIKLMESENYNILSTDTFYLGDINIDDYQSISFDLLPKKSGNIELPLMVSYKDANNKDYINTIKLTAKVYNYQEAKQTGLIPSSNLVYFLIPILIIIGVIIYRRYKRRQ